MGIFLSLLDWNTDNLEVSLDIDIDLIGTTEGCTVRMSVDMASCTIRLTDSAEPKCLHKGSDDVPVKRLFGA